MNLTTFWYLIKYQNFDYFLQGSIIKEANSHSNENWLLYLQNVFFDVVT